MIVPYSNRKITGPCAPPFLIISGIRTTRIELCTKHYYYEQIKELRFIVDLVETRTMIDPKAVSFYGN